MIRLWHRSEDQVIRDYADVKSACELSAMLPGRTPGAVKRRAMLLKVSIRRNGERHHLAKYTDHEIELCRLLYDDGMTAILIAEKMEMPYSYVRKIVSHLVRK